MLKILSTHTALQPATPWSAWAFSELFHKSNLLKEDHLRLSKSVWSSPQPRRPQPRVLPLLLLQSPASRGLLPEAARTK